MKTFRVTGKRDLVRDLVSGFLIALVSAPLSTGYAQIAGLPPQYGLYGSLCVVGAMQFKLYKTAGMLALLRRPFFYADSLFFSFSTEARERR